MTKDPDRSKLHAQIDENLKRAFQPLLEEPVPDRFRLLLEQLKQRETAEQTPERADPPTAKDEDPR